MLWKSVLKLDPEAEVLQMATATMEPHPLTEFLVLRSVLKFEYKKSKQEKTSG